MALPPFKGDQYGASRERVNALGVVAGRAPQKTLNGASQNVCVAPKMGGITRRRATKSTAVEALNAPWRQAAAGLSTLRSSAARTTE